MNPEKVRDAIESTRKKGVEHAFVQCQDGTESDLIEGHPDRVPIPTCPNDDYHTIFHTHTLPSTHPSDGDRLIAARLDPDQFCIASIDGEITCLTTDDTNDCWGTHR